MTVAPPGWYPDPQDDKNERWWDGSSWSNEHVRPRETPPVAPPPVPTAPPAYPTYPGSAYPGAAQTDSVDPGNTLSIIGIVCGVIALVFCPILLGPAGIVLGVIGHQKKERLGVTAIIVSAVGMVAGLALSFVVFRNLGN